MRLRLGVALLLVLASCTATAYAWSVRLAESDARALWGRTACGGHVHVRIGLPAFLAGREDIGWSEWAGPVASRRDCHIYIAHSLGWPTFCTVVMHEYGHLLGYKHFQGHTAEQRKVMHPYLEPDFQRCH